MKLTFGAGTAVAAIWLLGAGHASAQSVVLQKLTASPPVRGEYFGARVSMSGDVAAVSAPSAGFDLAAVTGGVVHVFRYGDGGTWIPEQILEPANRSRAVSFGMSVSVNGAVIVVSGYENNACTDKPLCIRAAAWVFRYDYVNRTWKEEQKLSPADAATVSLLDWQEQIGPYVSVSGTTMILGLHFDATRGPNTGSAYIYRFDGTGWTQEQKLTAANAAAGDWFGLEVAVSGDVAVVGAFFDTVDLFLRPGVRFAGSAHVYRYDGRRWNLEQVLTPYFDGQEGDLFGTSLAISGDVILVGATTSDEAEHDAGAAYVFRYNRGLRLWLQEQKLAASDGTAFAEFGRSVSLNGDVALVAAFRDFTTGERSGAVYVFRRVGGRWVEQEKIYSPNPAPFDRFGRSISLSGDVALICAYRKDDACPQDRDCDSGAAYLVAVGKQP